MNYYLIDFENVRTDGIKKLKEIREGDALIIFYSENCKNITLDVLDIIGELNLKYSSYKVKVGTKNALDFQLASHLGFLIGQGKKDAKYYIVSDDKGFDVVADFWRSQNVSVNCVSIKETEEKKETAKAADNTTGKKKKSKVSSKDLATLEEINALIGNENEPDEVLKIFNQYKTKQAICNAMSKHFKDSKRASAIYKMLKPLLKSKNKS